MPILAKLPGVETRFALLDHAPIGMFVLRHDLVVLFWNGCLEDWTGISRDELVGRNIGEVFPRLSEPRYVSRLEGIFAGGPPTIFSSQLHRDMIPSTLHDGRMRIQHTTVTSIPAAEGDRFHALFAVQDVSDLTHRVREYRAMRDQAVKEARERERAEARLRALYETAVSAMTMARLDDILQETLTAIQDVLRPDNVAILLVEPGTGELVAHAWTGFPDGPPLMRRQIGEGVAGRVAQTGQPLLVPDVNLDERYLSCDAATCSELCVPLRTGRRVVGVLNLESRQPAAFDEDDVRLLSILAGHLAAVVENARLVEGLEAKVRARTAEIRTEQEKSETILRYVGDAILMAGLDGCIRFANPAFSVLTGHPAGEVVGKDPHSVLGGRMTERERQSYQAALAAGEMWKGEVDAQRKDGLVYQVALTVAPVRDAEGGVTGWVYSLKDISRRKGLERARRKFMTNVSHELRTPVANIKLYAQLLRRGDAPQKSERYLQVLVDQADRLAHLIADILELADLDGGQAVTAWRPIALPSLIGDAIVGHQARAEAAGVTLEASPLAGEQPIVMGDRARLGQALGEVVENAITFSPSGGRVTLAVDLVEQSGRLWVKINVRDTGPGIPPGEQERIFDRFFRGSLAESGHVPGSGLGLSIAQDILRVHGGRLTVESDPAAGAADETGAGSTFALWLRAGPLPGEQVDQPPERVDAARVDELPPTE